VRKPAYEKKLKELCIILHSNGIQGRKWGKFRVKMAKMSYFSVFLPIQPTSGSW